MMLPPFPSCIQVSWPILLSFLERSQRLLLEVRRAKWQRHREAAVLKDT